MNMPNRKNNNRRRGNGAMRSNVASNPFLQCAFASVDFEVDKVRGVPDNFSGRSVVKRHRLTDPITNLPANDAYYVFMPVPGMAYYTATLSAGTPIPNTQVFNGIQYPDTPILFPPSSESSNVTAARCIGKYIEFVPTVNATTWTGSITVWKIPVTMSNSKRVVTDIASTMLLDGTVGISTVSGSNYVAGNNMGAYAVSTSISGDHPFTPILMDYSSIPLNGPVTGEFGRFTGTFTGLMDHYTIVVKITGNASYTLKVHECNEYMVPNTSILFDYASASADLDVRALLAYKTITQRLPVAVSYYENAKFWETVLRLFNQATAYGSLLPGALGMASQGANLMGVAAASLFV